MNEDYDYLYKFVITGDSGIGKTQLISRYSRDIYDVNSKSTIGVEFCSKLLTIDNLIIKLQLWDTAGQERYRAISGAYYRGAVGVLICFDITNYKSFQNVEKWLKECKDHNSDADIVLIGTKCDLEHIRCISYNEANSYAKSKNLEYYETSALNNTGINNMFKDFVFAVHNKKIQQNNEINAITKNHGNNGITVVDGTVISAPRLSKPQNKFSCNLI
jgi:Ras-related protein Rab-11A